MKIKILQNSAVKQLKSGNKIKDWAKNTYTNINITLQITITVAYITITLHALPNAKSALEIMTMVVILPLPLFSFYLIDYLCSDKWNDCNRHYGQDYDPIIAFFSILSHWFSMHQVINNYIYNYSFFFPTELSNCTVRQTNKVQCIQISAYFRAV